MIFGELLFAGEAGLVEVTLGALGAVVSYVTVAVPDAVLLLPAASCAAPALTEAMTVPSVIPVTATLYVVPLPVTVTILVPPAVPAIVTPEAEKPVTDSLKVTV